MTGVQVIYIGGIDEPFDRELYLAAGRDVNDEGCTIQGEGRRDMFWRCESDSEAHALAARLASVHPRREFVVSVKSYDEHWEEKMASIEASLPEAFDRSTERPE